MTVAFQVCNLDSTSGRSHHSNKTEKRVDRDQQVKVFFRKSVNDDEYLTKHKGVLLDLPDSLM